MTTPELERIARNVIPSTGATGWRITVTGETHGGATGYAVVPILFGRLDGRPVFEGSQRDCRRMYQLLTGTSTSRRARDLPATARPGESGRALTEAPQSLTSADGNEIGSGPRADASGERISSGASIRLCEGCDQPLPEDGRSDRTTHGGACRIAAFRRRAATNAARPDADSGTGDVTPSGASSEAPASRPAAAEPAPTEGAHQRQPDQLLTEASVAGTSMSTTAYPARSHGVAVQLVRSAPAP